MKTRISSPQAKIRPRPADENPAGLDRLGTPDGGAARTEAVNRPSPPSGRSRGVAFLVRTEAAIPLGISASLSSMN